MVATRCAGAAGDDGDDRSAMRRQSVRVRNDFTGAGKDAGFSEGWQYARATNLVYIRVLGATAAGLRQRLKLKPRASIRDNLSITDLGFVMLAEALTTDEARRKGRLSDEAIRRATRIVRRARDDFRDTAS